MPRGTPPPPEPPAAVATMWYWLGPIGVMVLVALFAVFFWGRDSSREPGAAPTTGISEEARPEGSKLDREPGGKNTDPRFDSADDEIKYRTR